MKYDFNFCRCFARMKYCETSEKAFGAKIEQKNLIIVMNSKRSLDKSSAVLTSTAASRPVKYYSGVKLK